MPFIKKLSEIFHYNVWFLEMQEDWFIYFINVSLFSTFTHASLLRSYSFFALIQKAGECQVAMDATEAIE